MAGEILRHAAAVVMSEKDDSTEVSAPSTGKSNCKTGTSVTVTAIEDPGLPRPTLGRRKTTREGDLPLGDAQTLRYSGEEDALTKIGNFLWKVHTASVMTRYALYILPVSGLLAIPLALFDTIYKHERAGGIRLLGLFIWLEIIWLSLWACKLCAKALPILFQAACGLISTGIRKYSLVLMALEIPLSLFIWSIVAYGTVPVICVFDQQVCGTSWVSTLQTALKATIAVTAIFLAEKFFVQLVSINYHRKQYDSKIRHSKRVIHILDLMYEASRTLFPSFCREFEEEDNQIHDFSAVTQKSKLGSRVFHDMGRVRDKVTAAFGNMASEISGKQVFNPTAAHSIVIEALETRRASKALARRLWLSFVAEGQDSLYQKDLLDILGSSRTEEAEEIFAALDRDGNGDVSLEEMTMLVVEVGLERKNRSKSMHDISQAIEVLDRLLSLGVLIAIAFVYAAFFSKTLASKTTQLWSTFTGLAFAIGGTVTEFLGCCIFLFVKHPYDVGDRVDISPAGTLPLELVVEHISLMYTVFRRVDSDKQVQIPHTLLNTVWIDNVSRSKAMKERLTFSVSAATSDADILALRTELEKFVRAPENKRDYQQEIDIELLGVGDLKQLDLRVEIRHKANFSNELLRSSRRNKFMCELLSSMRRVPIEPPGGAAPPLGDPSNPTYSVTVPDADAQAARAKHDAEKEGARMYPRGTGLPLFGPQAVTSGLSVPGLAAIGSLTGRRGSALSNAITRDGETASERRFDEILRASRDFGRRPPAV